MVVVDSYQLDKVVVAVALISLSFAVVIAAIFVLLFEGVVDVLDARFVRIATVMVI